MQDHGGFEHNRQGLRVVDELERRYPDFNGLNLTFETREGIISHTTDYDTPTRIPEFESTGTSTLEAQTINVADEIAYNSHDLDDGIKSGYIKFDELMQVTLWKEVHSAAAETISDPSLRIYQAIRNLINRQVTDVITHTDRMIQKLRIKSCEDVRSKEPIMGFSPKQLQLQRELKDFLYSHLYNHYKAIKMHNKARRYVEALFNTYVEDPRQLPPAFSQQKDKYQAVSDYIAGMTDRFAQDEYERLFTPYTKM
jgi:dGTPase